MTPMQSFLGKSPKTILDFDHGHWLLITGGGKSKVTAMKEVKDIVSGGFVVWPRTRRMTTAESRAVYSGY